jgi:DNA-directed RNA polymerase subunit RPC12/RpoP
MLTEKQKRLLKEYVKYVCEECHNEFEESELLIHHLTRQGGNGRKLPQELIDSFRNLKVLCKECSQKYHYHFQRSNFCSLSIFEIIHFAIEIYFINMLGYYFEFICSDF